MIQRFALMGDTRKEMEKLIYALNIIYLSLSLDYVFSLTAAIKE